MSNEKVKIGIALAAGLCIGGGVGYFVAERRFRQQAEAEIAGVKDLYHRLREENAQQVREDWNPAPVDEESYPVERDPESLEEEVARLGYGNVQKLSQYDPNYVHPTEQEPDAESVEQDLREEDEYVRNIRVVDPHREVDPDDVTRWDRSSHQPYVITEAEYRMDRPEFEKLELTYYRGDDTLADPNDAYIPDKNGTAGDENLKQYFGLASGDPNVLHVRNERVGADFEISLNEAPYAQHVMGFDDIEDSMIIESKRQIRKMRPSE